MLVDTKRKCLVNEAWIGCKAQLLQYKPTYQAHLKDRVAYTGKGQHIMPLTKNPELLVNAVSALNGAEATRSWNIRISNVISVLPERARKAFRVGLGSLHGGSSTLRARGLSSGTGT
jgi:hypothetical protein